MVPQISGFLSDIYNLESQGDGYPDETRGPTIGMSQTC